MGLFIGRARIHDLSDLPAHLVLFHMLGGQGAWNIDGQITCFHSVTKSIKMGFLTIQLRKVVSTISLNRFQGLGLDIRFIFRLPCHITPLEGGLDIAWSPVLKWSGSFFFPHSTFYNSAYCGQFFRKRKSN